MRYHNITKDDMTNGEGLRVVLWLSGCEHHCPGCQNPITWDINDGLVFDDPAKQEIYAELSKNYVNGITFSGGDPLHKENREEVLSLIKEIRKDFPNKTIWVYTGYEYTELVEQGFTELFDYIDVLVDGRYVEKLKDNNYHWAGSTNQTVIHFN